jgi:hypothetical protein
MEEQIGRVVTTTRICASATRWNRGPSSFLRRLHYRELERFKENCGRKKAQKTQKKTGGFLRSGRPLRLPDWRIGDWELKSAGVCRNANTGHSFHESAIAPSRTYFGGLLRHRAVN